MKDMQETKQQKLKECKIKVTELKGKNVTTWSGRQN